MNWAALHALLVNFTAGLVPTSLLADILGRRLGRASLANAGRWMITAAAIATPFTAIAGWMWWHEDHPDHWPMPWHQWIGTGLAIVFILIAVWRWKCRPRAALETMASWPYVVVLCAVLAALVVQADLGGAMVFGRGFFFQTSEQEEHEHGHGHESEDHVTPDEDAVPDKQ